MNNSDKIKINKKEITCMIVVLSIFVLLSLIINIPSSLGEGERSFNTAILFVGLLFGIGVNIIPLLILIVKNFLKNNNYNSIFNVFFYFVLISLSCIGVFFFLILSAFVLPYYDQIFYFI
jgi:hypothetical protein